VYVCAVSSARLRNLLVRSTSGVIFVALVVGALFGGAWTAFVLFAVLSGIGLAEYLRLTGRQEASAPDWLAVASGIAVFATLFLVATEKWEMTAMWVVALAWLIHLSVDVLTVRSYPFSRTAVTLASWAYVAVPFACIGVVSNLTGEWDARFMMGYFFILWANDTGAYLTGMAVGKTKLFPAVSPNKTWEGLVGGVSLALFVSWLVAGWLDELPMAVWLLMAGCVGVFGTLGDLYESYLKRAAGVKDSGRIMPGHGGVLDRFDGLFFSLPAFLAFYFLLNL